MLWTDLQLQACFMKFVPHSHNPHPTPRRLAVHLSTEKILTEFTGNCEKFVPNSLAIRERGDESSVERKRVRSWNMYKSHHILDVIKVYRWMQSMEGHGAC